MNVSRARLVPSERHRSGLTEVFWGLNAFALFVSTAARQLFSSGDDVTVSSRSGCLVETSLPKFVLR